MDEQQQNDRDDDIRKRIYAFMLIRSGRCRMIDLLRDENILLNQLRDEDLVLVLQSLETRLASSDSPACDDREQKLLPKLIAEVVAEIAARELLR